MFIRMWISIKVIHIVIHTVFIVFIGVWVSYPHYPHLYYYDYIYNNNDRAAPLLDRYENYPLSLYLINVSRYDKLLLWL